MMKNNERLGDSPNLKKEEKVQAEPGKYFEHFIIITNYCCPSVFYFYFGELAFKHKTYDLIKASLTIKVENEHKRVFIP